MEKIDPEYMDSWNKLMSYQKALMETLNNISKPTKIQIEGLGEVDVAHLRNHMGIAEEAFDENEANGLLEDRPETVGRLHGLTFALQYSKPGE